MFKFEFYGVNRLNKNLRRIGKQFPDVTDKRLNTWGQNTASGLKKKRYARKRPGQKYKRTGTLGRRWHHRRVKKLTHAIRNDARQKGRTYPVFVVGNNEGKNQAWMHKGRWWVGRVEVDRQIPSLIKELNNDIRKLF